MARFDPFLFTRQVRQEVAKVTWPTRKETLITTGMVFAFVVVAAIFFTIVDYVIGLGVRGLFGFGRSL
jgi:preprotein translocase subunit SecE